MQLHRTGRRCGGVAGPAACRARHSAECLGHPKKMSLEMLMKGVMVMVYEDSM